MSAEEIIGSVLTATLLGTTIGVMLGALATSHRVRGAELRRRRLEAYANWLAAQRTLSGASLSFVAAFRALACEARESHHLPLRTTEAQRSRALWCEAVRRLDQAEAELLVFSGDREIKSRLLEFNRITPEELRGAIDGGPSDAARVAERLRDSDARAEVLVCQVADEVHSRRSGLRKVATRIADYLQGIVDHWSKR